MDIEEKFQQLGEGFGTENKIETNDDGVTKSEHDAFDNHPKKNHYKKTLSKKFERRFKKFFRSLLRRKGYDDDKIEQNVSTTLDEMIEEYNKEEFARPESNLNLSPHYIHHKEMKERELKYLFARRSCHLPGNSWWQDWLQFICNNHPLFGLCLHHRLHPLSIYDRTSILISSISFGIVATNVVYLHYLMSERNFEEDIIKFKLEVWEGFNVQAVLTSGVATLLFFNGLLHVLFDILMWHLSAATCCHHLENHSTLKKYGSYATIAIALICVTLATLVLLYRVSYQLNDEYDHEWMDIIKIETFFAVLGYILHLSATYFIISPFIVTVMFSGVLGCIPFLGGRPKDIQLVLDAVIQEKIKYSSGISSNVVEEEHQYYII